MKIIFFGLGSIGKRHAGLISKNFKYKLFAYKREPSQEDAALPVKYLYSWKDVMRISPDVAFITNPTSLHIKTAIRCADAGMHLFIEKPIGRDINGLDKLTGIVKKNKLTAYVGYHMRFNPVIDRIKRYTSGRDNMHARIVVSSYLPDWRPSRDYRKNYSAHESMGGGAVLDLSHEIDYGTYIFGDILNIIGIRGRISKLKIKCEDFSDIIMRCKKGIVNLHMNFFSKNIERSIIVDFDDSGYLKGDLLKNSLTVYRGSKTEKYHYLGDLNKIYLSQLRYFFDNIGNPGIMNDLSKASTLFKKVIDFKDETA